MSVSTNQQLGIDFTSQQPGDSISGVPLKKRLFCSSLCSSPSSTRLNMPPKDCGRPCKQALVMDPEAASSLNVFGLALGTNVIMKNSQQVLREQHDDGNLNSERCQLNLGLDHPSTRLHNDVDLAIDSAEHSVRGVSLDLNIPIGSWDDISDQVVQTGRNCVVGKAHLQEKKPEVNSIQTPLGIQVANTGMNKAMRGSSNLQTSNDYKDSDIGLDLQLKLPCRQELRMDWAVNSPPHLTLSLMGNKSDENPELDEDKIQNEMESSQPVVQNVKSEPSEGVLQNDTSKVACSTEHKAASGNERFEECEVRSLNVVGDNGRWTPTCTVDYESTSRSLGLNCLTVNAESRPSGCAPLHQNGPNMNETMIGRCSDLGSSRLDERVEVVKEGYIFKHVVGDVDRTPDVAESLPSNEKESISIVTVTGLASSSFHDSGVSDAKEPVTLDGISEGSAEMECSDGEYYTSSKVVTESEITVDSYENNVEGERRHIILDAGITTHVVENDSREVKVGSGKAQADLHVEVPAEADTKKKQILGTEQTTDQNAVNPGIRKNGKSPLLATNLPGKPYKAVSSSSHRLDGPSQVVAKNFLNEKLQVNPKKSITFTDMKVASVVKAAVKIGNNHEDNQKMNASEDSVFSKKQKTLERSSEGNVGLNKPVEDREDDQNKKVSLPPVGSFGAPSSSNWERSTDKSCERDRSNSRGRRDESLTFEGYKRQDENFCRPEYDFRNIRRNRRENYQSVCFDGDKAYETQYPSEVSNSNYKRFPRPSEEEKPHPSHFTSRRRSPPVNRDLLRPLGNQFAGTYMGRESDPHEAQMRGLRNRMGDRLVHPRSHMHYERSKRDTMHRDRSSRLPPVSFHGHSAMVRIDRRQPRQPCFPEDVIGRRPTSPPYSSGDMRDMCAIDASGRDVPRDARRLDFIDQQDAIEEYRGPLHFVQPPELVDEVVDRRIFYESDGFPGPGPFDEHFDGPGPYDEHFEDEEMCLHYPDELDQRRTIRFRPDADVVGDDRDSMRDFEGRSRNQLGNGTSRPRYSGQAHGYKYQNIPGFRDGGIGDNVRMKRRRF